MPLGRIKIIRRNGTSDFSDNSNISVLENMGTVAAPLVGLLVTRPNSKKKYQNNRNQGWATREKILLVEEDCIPGILYFLYFLLFNFILHGQMHTMCVNFIFLSAAFGPILNRRWPRKMFDPCMRHNVHLSMKYEIEK